MSQTTLSQAGRLYIGIARNKESCQGRGGAIVVFSDAISSSRSQRRRWLNGRLGRLTRTVHAVVSRVDLQEMFSSNVVRESRRAHAGGTVVCRVDCEVVAMRKPRPPAPFEEGALIVRRRGSAAQWTSVDGQRPVQFPSRTTPPSLIRRRQSIGRHTSCFQLFWIRNKCSRFSFTFVKRRLQLFHPYDESNDTLQKVRIIT